MVGQIISVTFSILHVPYQWLVPIARLFSLRFALVLSIAVIDVVLD